MARPLWWFAAVCVISYMVDIHPSGISFFLPCIVKGADHTGKIKTS